MPYSDVLQVNIATTAAAPTQQGFGVPLILGAATAWGASTDKIRYYSNLLGLTTDGFSVTDPEYLAASAIFAQSSPPPQIAVGKRTNKPTQMFVVTVLQAVSGKVYTVYINGVLAAPGGGEVNGF